jgi:glucokinase
MIQNTGILIGIDLGGTNVRAGVFAPDGELILFKDTPIEAARGPQAGLETIYNLVESVLVTQTQPLLAIGIGSTGPLDRERGCIQNPFTLPGWEDVDIVSPLMEKYGVPVALENDADAAALGEAWVGAGIGAERLVMVTIGTGVGFAFVINGKLYRGMGGEHPEGGHVLVDPNGPACYCGARGCLESLVSGPAIAASAQLVAQTQAGYLSEQAAGDVSQIDAALVFAGARQGDKQCQEIIDQIAEYIGLGLVSIIMLTLPDRIVLTGGVIRSYDLLEPGVKSVLQQHSLMIPAEKVDLQLAALGQTAGMVGAARAAQMKFQETSL